MRCKQRSPPVSGWSLLRVRELAGNERRSAFLRGRDTNSLELIRSSDLSAVLPCPFMVLSPQPPLPRHTDGPPADLAVSITVHVQELWICVAANNVGSFYASRALASSAASIERVRGSRIPEGNVTHNPHCSGILSSSNSDEALQGHIELGLLLPGTHAVPRHLRRPTTRVTLMNASRHARQPRPRSSSKAGRRRAASRGRSPASRSSSSPEHWAGLPHFPLCEHYKVGELRTLQSSHPADVSGG